MPLRTPDPLDILVGARIRIFRTLRGMSQSDLAGKIGVCFQQVQKYEKGTNRVGASRLSRIAEILGIPVGELFETSGDKSADSQSLLQPLIGREAVRFLRAFSRITDPRVRNSIARLVEAIADPQPKVKSSIVHSSVVKRFVPRLAGISDVPLDPHQRWLYGQSLLFKYNAESWQRGIAIFRAGIRENPTFSPYYSSLVQIKNSEYFIHPGCFRDLGKANAMLDLAKQAVQLDPADSRAHLCCGWSHAMAPWGDEMAAHIHMERACELSGNDKWTLLSYAHYCAFSGSIVQAELRAKQALILSPMPSRLEWVYHGINRFLCGNYAGAVEAIDSAQGIVKTLPAWRAATLFYLGERAMAQDEAQRFLDGVRLSWVGLDAPSDEAITRWMLQVHPISVPARWETLRHGLRGAGLPVEGIVQLS